MDPKIPVRTRATNKEGLRLSAAFTSHIPGSRLVPSTPRDALGECSPRSTSGIVESRASLRPAVAVWILVILAQAQFRKRSVTELAQGTAFDSQVIFQIVVWAFLGLVAIYLIRSRRVNWQLLRYGPLKWYCGFMFVALGSSFYSPAPALSAFRVLQHLVALILVASMGVNLKRIHVFATMFVGATAILVILGALGLTFGLSWITPPSQSWLWTAEPEWRFASAFGHPTQIATLAAIAIFTADDARRRLYRVAVGGFNLAALGLTASRTALAGAFIGFAVVMAAKRRLTLFVCLCGALATGVMLSPAWSGLLTNYLSRTQTSDQLTSLNGRLVLYQDASKKIQEHWLLGEGFLANRVDVLDEQADGSGTTHAHNVMLEALTSTGVIGGLFVLAASLHICILPFEMLRRYKGRPALRREAILLAASLPPVIGGCILDAGFATTLNTIGWAFMVLAARGQMALNACEIAQKSGLRNRALHKREIASLLCWNAKVRTR